MCPSFWCNNWGKMFLSCANGNPTHLQGRFIYHAKWEGIQMGIKSDFLASVCYHKACLITFVLSRNRCLIISICEMFWQAELSAVSLTLALINYSASLKHGFVSSINALMNSFLHSDFTGLEQPCLSSSCLFLFPYFLLKIYLFIY